jgi:hypothetical protein
VIAASKNREQARVSGKVFSEEGVTEWSPKAPEE